MVSAIRYRHLKQLVRTAAALPGRKLDVALWRRLEPWTAIEPPAAPSADRPDPPAPAPQAEPDARQIAQLRALVAACLARLGERIEEVLGPALARARQSWDKVDDLVIVDRGLSMLLTGGWRQLETAAASPDRAVAAVAVEGLIALEAARGLTVLAERRLSALIRLRVRGDGDLLPGGRPFLDLGAALVEAAQAWA